jgi:peptidoglycan/xylan/chitin deacetylase (PgdA/CDA1 family)
MEASAMRIPALPHPGAVNPIRRSRSLASSLVSIVVAVTLLGAEVQASSVIRHGPREQPWVALTFDDGYSVERCARIVRTLRAKRAPATFFINGSAIGRDPDRWRKLLRGFSVANHTLSHKDLTRLDATSIRAQIELNERIVERALDRPMLRLLRPSYGAHDRQVVRIAAALGYHTVLWDTDGGDGRAGATTRSVIQAGSRGDDGAIVLLHCGPATTPAAVGPIIDRYRSRGYRLVDLGQMLDLEPPATACRVHNADSGATEHSLKRAVRAASAGDHLTVRGTCLGSARIGRDLTITGVRTEAAGPPTLDGIGTGPVLTVKPGRSVTLQNLTIQGGARGIHNHGNLTLDDVIVRGNTAAVGAGVYNASASTLTLNGTTSIRDNEATALGGGVINAGLLVLNDSSSITRNTAPGVGGGIYLFDAGAVDGVGCAPEDDANVRGNTPDDCFWSAPNPPAAAGASAMGSLPLDS